MKCALAVLALAAFAGSAEAKTVTCRLGLEDRLFQKGYRETLKLEVGDNTDRIVVQSGDDITFAKLNPEVGRPTLAKLLAYDPPKGTEDEFGIERRIFVGAKKVSETDGSVDDALITFQETRVHETERLSGRRVVVEVVYHCGPDLYRVAPISHLAIRIPLELTLTVIPQEASKPKPTRETESVAPAAADTDTAI